MTEPAIARLSPAPGAHAPGANEHGATTLSDAELVALYTVDVSDPWLRVNFVSSIDGAATEGGLSGGLSDAADRRVFDLLRRLCDVVVVGAGTVRAEGYGAMRVDDESQRARRAVGLTEHPVFAIVSASLDLDPASPIFRDAPQRPIIMTTREASSSRPDELSALADVAEVVVCGSTRVEPARLVTALVERGLRRIHCEGGPHLFGDLIAAGAVDELCLTLSPQLVAGPSSRISAGAAPIAPVGMRLAHILRADDTVLLRYVR